MSSSISVVIPLYNKAAYVAEAVRSACEQRCPPLEVIVVNDGSTDAGAAVVRSLPYKNIRLIEIANAGVSVARNTGIEAAQGDFIAFLDADDWWSPHFLCAIRRMIDQHPQCSIFSTSALELVSGQSLPALGATAIAQADVETIENFFRERTHRSLFNNSSLCVLRRLLVEQDIRFPPGEAHGEDHDFWFQLVERGPVAFLDLPLAAYRRGVAQSLTQLFEWRELEPAYVRLWQRTFVPDYPAHLREAARHMVHRRQTSFARNRLVQAGDVRGALRLLLSQNHRPGASLFWWSTLLGCCLPGPLRGHFLAPGKGWKDHPLIGRFLCGRAPKRIGGGLS